MPYKNKDVFAEKYALEIADRVDKFFEAQLERIIRQNHVGKHWSPIALELRHAAIDEIQKIFSDKMLELKQKRRDNEWRYKPQDVIYPELKEDLKKFFPGYGPPAGLKAEDDWAERRGGFQ